MAAAPGESTAPAPPEPPFDARPFGSLGSFASGPARKSSAGSALRRSIGGARTAEVDLSVPGAGGASGAGGWMGLLASALKYGSSALGYYRMVRAVAADVCMLLFVFVLASAALVSLR
jgi:hypothetical protein